MLQPLNQAPTGLPAPSSRDRLCCRAGLTAPPYSHRWPSHPSTHPHLLLFSEDGRRTSKPSYSSAWETTAEYSLALCRSLPRPHHRPSPWCSWRDLVNMVNERHPSAVDCTRKIMIPPPDSWDPPEGPLYFVKKNVPPAVSSDPPAISSHARKCLLITHKKMNTPPASWNTT